MAVFVVVSVTGVQMHIPVHFVQHSHGALGDGNSPEKSRSEEGGFADILGRPGENNFALKRLHEWAGYSLIILGVAHLLFNRKSMLTYVGQRR